MGTSGRVAESSVSRYRHYEAQRVLGRHKGGGREEEGRKRGRKEENRKRGGGERGEKRGEGGRKEGRKKLSLNWVLASKKRCSMVVPLWV